MIIVDKDVESVYFTYNAVLNMAFKLVPPVATVGGPPQRGLIWLDFFGRMS